MRTIMLLVFAVTLVGFVQKEDSHGNRVRFPSDTVPVYMIGQFPIDETELQQVFDTWTATCSSLQLVLAGTTEADLIPPGSITIQWEPEWFGEPGDLGETMTWFEDGYIVGANIFVNGTANLSLAVPDCSSEKYHLARVIAHEAGHAVGFDHSPFGRSLMFATGTRNLALGPLITDDRAGLCAVYPKEVAPKKEAGGCNCIALPDGPIGIATAIIIVIMALLYWWPFRKKE